MRYVMAAVAGAAVLIGVLKHQQMLRSQAQKRSHFALSQRAEQAYESGDIEKAVEFMVAAVKNAHDNGDKVSTAALSIRLKEFRLSMARKQALNHWQEAQTLMEKGLPSDAQAIENRLRNALTIGGLREDASKITQILKELSSATSIQFIRDQLEKLTDEQLAALGQGKDVGMAPFKTPFANIVLLERSKRELDREVAIREREEATQKRIAQREQRDRDREQKRVRLRAGAVAWYKLIELLKTTPNGERRQVASGAHLLKAACGSDQITSETLSTWVKDHGLDGFKGAEMIARYTPDLIFSDDTTQTAKDVYEKLRKANPERVDRWSKNNSTLGHLSIENKNRFSRDESFGAVHDTFYVD